MAVLSQPPSIIIRDYLKSKGLFGDLTQTWPVYITHMPDKGPNDIGTIYDTGGEQEGRLMQGTEITHPTIQIRVRSKEYNDGWAKLAAIADDLELVKDVAVVIGSATFKIKNASQITPILPLGQEEGTSKRRFLFTINYRLTIKEE